jgi:hypothetical protein
MTAFALRNDASSPDLTSWPVRHQGASGISMAASQYDPAVERQRAALISAIRYLVKNPTNWSAGQAAPIETISAETAVAFMRCLPVDRAFPLIAPDGEGGVVFLWDVADCRALITCDGAKLLLVRDPGAPNSFHFSPLRFDGEAIPSIILEHLPRR